MPKSKETCFNIYSIWKTVCIAFIYPYLTRKKYIFICRHMDKSQKKDKSLPARITTHVTVHESRRCTSHKSLSLSRALHVLKLPNLFSLPVGIQVIHFIYSQLYYFWQSISVTVLFISYIISIQKREEIQFPFQEVRIRGCQRTLHANMPSSILTMHRGNVSPHLFHRNLSNPSSLLRANHSSQMKAIM